MNDMYMKDQQQQTLRRPFDRMSNVTTPLPLRLSINRHTY